MNQMTNLVIEAVLVIVKTTVEGNLPCVSRLIPEQSCMICSNVCDLGGGQISEI